MVFSCSWKIWVELLQLGGAELPQSSIFIKVCEGIGMGIVGWQDIDMLFVICLLLFVRLLLSEVRATYLVL